jgi:hypothetical protein
MDFNKMLVSHFHLLKTFENNKKIQEGKVPDQGKKKEEKEKKKSGNQTISGGYGAQRAKQKNRQEGQTKEVFGMSERRALLYGVLQIHSLQNG